MNILYYILGAVLCTLFFLNINNAAQLLCRIMASFAALLLYNAVASYIPLPHIGINFITVLLCAILNFPGGALLLLLQVIV